MSEDNIAVAIRVRPIIKTEKKKKLDEQWTVSGNEIYLTETGFREIDAFTFDYIFDTSSTNADLYQIVQPLVLSTLNGFNATIFAYGQTSSGKTHSILGTDSDPGIIPLSAKDIFSAIAAKGLFKYIVRLSYVEIYNEKVNDLLDVNNKDLKIRVTEDGRSSVLLGMHEQIVLNEEEMMAVIQKGNKNRQIGETKMNERSSRSHVICDVLIESSALDECRDGEVEKDTPVKAGHLYIVDLAGSERISQTGATGVRLNEGVHINKSLSTLISVITQLGDGRFVSYRDSKLTRLLSNALGGNSRTLIVAAITPVSVDDSLSTLKFARSAKTIKTKPRMNEIMSQQSIIKRQQSREKELMKELSEKSAEIDKLRSELDESRKVYVPARNKPKRRHTLGVVMPQLSDISSVGKPLEPIIEHSVTEEDDYKASHSVSDRHSYGDVFQSLLPIPSRNKTSRSSDIAFPTTCIDLTSDIDLTSKSPTAEADVIDTAQYHELKDRFDNLDQSHALLKEFTKLELEVYLQEETFQLRGTIEKQEKEIEKFHDEVLRLKRCYEILDVSHIDLKEFTKIEMDLAVEERTQQLQKEVDELRKQSVGNVGLQEDYARLKEKLSIKEAEEEILQNLQAQQLQRRCNELVARIQELESLTTSETKSDRSVNGEVEEDAGESRTDTIQLDALQEKCEMLEASIKRTEMYSKVLLAENNALKGQKKKLVRSVSDTNLAEIVGEWKQEETKEDFQHIFKSLRKLTSTLISGSDVTQSLAGTPMKMTQMSPFMSIGRIRTRSEKPSFVERMSEGLQEEEINELKMENNMLKEHTNELLAKLKFLNDKINGMDVSVYEAKLRDLQDEKDTLERKLKDGDVQDKLVGCSGEESKTEFEMEKHFEVLANNYRNAQSQIEQLSNELNTFKNQASQSMDLTKEQFIDSDVVSKQIEESKELIVKLEQELKQKQHDHDMDKEALEYTSTELDEAMEKIMELQNKHKTLNKEHQQVIVEVGNVKKLEADLAKANAMLQDRDRLMQKFELEAELVFKQYMACKEASEMLYAEVIDKSTKLKDLQAEYDTLALSQADDKNNCLKMQSLLDEKETVVTKEPMNKMADEQRQPEEEKEGWHVQELESTVTSLKEEISMLTTSQEEKNLELAKLEGLLEEKEGEIVALQSKLDESKEHANKLKMEADVVQAKHQQQISKLNVEIETLRADHGENSEEIVKFEAFVAEYERNVDELEVELEETRQDKLAAATNLKLHEEKAQTLDSKMVALNAEISRLKDEHEKKLVSLSGEHNIEIESYRTNIALLQQEILKMEHLQSELNALNEKLGKDKESHDQGAEQLKKLYEEQLQESKTKEAQCLQMQSQLESEVEKSAMKLRSLEDALQSSQKDYHSSLETIQSHQEEIAVLKTSLAKFEALLAEKERQVAELLVELDDTKQECHQNKMAAAVDLRVREEEINTLKSKTVELSAEISQLTQEHEKKLLSLVEEHEREIESFKAKVLLLQDAKQSQDQRQDQMNDLIQKYEQALSKIAALEEEVKAAKLLQEKIDRERQMIANLSSTLSPEERIKQLEHELHKKRYELRLERGMTSTLKKDYEAALKSKAELESKLEGKQEKQEKPKFNTLTSILVAQKKKEQMKLLEDKCAESNSKLMAAEEVVRGLKDEQTMATAKIEALQSSLDEITHKYETLKAEHELYLANNQTQPKVEDGELAILRNELEANRKLHDGEIAIMADRVKDVTRRYEELKQEYELNNQTRPINNDSQLTLLRDELIANRQLHEEQMSAMANRVEEVTQRYEEVKQKHELSLVELHQAHLNVEDKEVTILRDELQAIQKLHERKVSSMTEDFDCKYRAYSDKYATLKKSAENTARNKDAIIKQLEAQLEQCNKENRNRQATIGGSLLEANKTDANAKRKIFDLQQQLQAARQECRQKDASNEMRIAKLQDDYETKLAAVRRKLDALRPEVALMSPEGVAAAREREQFAKRIDAELLSVPSKLAMLHRVNSVRLSPSACLACSRIQQHVALLVANCAQHPLWRLLEPETNAVELHQDREVRTDRFALLTDTRDVFVRLLQLAGGAATLDVIKARLACAGREIDEYTKLLKDKQVFLRFLHEALKTAGVSIAQGLQGAARDACEQCQVYRVCFNVICTLTERVKCSLVIIEGLENRLTPLKFCTDSAKGCDDKLKKLMITFDELTSDVQKQQRELDELKEKYKRAKCLAKMRYDDVKLMESVLVKENYSVNYQANPIQITKVEPEVFDLTDENPRPLVGRSRDSGRKSLGATPKHFSPFFVTPDEHKEAKHQARRHK